MSPKSLVENRIKEIRRNTRRKYSAEEKVRIVIEGLRGRSIYNKKYIVRCAMEDMIYNGGIPFIPISASSIQRYSITDVAFIITNNYYIKK